MLSTKNLVVTLSSLVLVAHASVDFDMDDVPNSCKAVCAPIGQLSDRCDTDLRSDIDRDEDLLQAQCICTNDSFDVAERAALCASCMHYSVSEGEKQGNDDDDDKYADRDDLEDIDRLMTTCGFSSTSWDPSASVTSVAVSATAATNIDQLTTTIGLATNNNGQPQQTSAGSGSGSSSANNGNEATRTTMMTTSGGATQATEQSATSSTPNAAPGGAGPLNGNRGVFGVAAMGVAAVFGAMMLH